MYSGLKNISLFFIFTISFGYSQDWRLAWSDEFNGSGGPISSVNWFHQTQLPNGSSWYNGEIQHYTNRTENSYVSNGTLKIVAKKETYTNQGRTKQYTSARLNSKYAFGYGRIEIKAKLPKGVGTWPAIWMLGKNIKEPGAYWQTKGFGTTSWPACGEVDIMEHWGSNQNYVQSAIHTPSSHGGTVNLGGQYINTATTQFHIYTIDWSEEKMVFSVDGNVHYTYNPATKNSDTWPFDAKMYLLLNIAIVKAPIFFAISKIATVYFVVPLAAIHITTSLEVIFDLLKSFLASSISSSDFSDGLDKSFPEKQNFNLSSGHPNVGISSTPSNIPILPDVPDPTYTI